MTEKEINKIVSENLNYVKSVANQYKGKGVEFDDLVSEGTLAMLMAARKFQADRGTDFVAYAGPFVHKAISQAIDKQSGLYRLPKDQKKFAPRNADKAVSVDAPLSANNPYTLLDILNEPDISCYFFFFRLNIVLSHSYVIKFITTKVRLLFRTTKFFLTFLKNKHKKVVYMK
jgi:RNA polymerase primary sigma factor